GLLGVAGLRIVLSIAHVQRPERYFLSTYVAAWLNKGLRFEDITKCEFAFGPGQCKPDVWKITMGQSASLTGVIGVVLLGLASVCMRACDRARPRARPLRRPRHAWRYGCARPRQVPDLAGRTVRAPVQPAAEDHGKADAAADPDEDEVGDTLRRAAVRFRGRGKVDVILENDRSAQIRPKCCQQSAVPVRQVPGERDLAGRRVDEAGGTDHEQPY